MYSERRTLTYNMSLFSGTIILLLLQFSTTSAQQGQDCSDHRACGLHQSCYVGYCICELGFMRTGRDCHPVRKYGEPCLHDEQCIDHRMSCQPIDANNSSKICLCNKLHERNDENQDCVPTMNVTVLLSKLVGDDPSVDIMREADSTFLSMGWAGIAVAALLFLLGTGLIVYGCCLYECYDRCVGEPPLPTRCPPTCVNYKREQFSNVT